MGNLKGQDHLHQIGGKPKDQWWSKKQRGNIDDRRAAEVRQKAVHLWVTSIQGKENYHLLLKNYMLAWSRIAQFEHIRRTGELKQQEKKPGLLHYAAFACDGLEVKDGKEGRFIGHLISEPRFIVQRPLPFEGRMNRRLGGMQRFDPESEFYKRKRQIHDEEPYWMGLAPPKPCKDLLEVNIEEIDDVVNLAYMQKRKGQQRLRAQKRLAASMGAL